MDENDVQVRERLTALESSYKSLHKRVDKQEELIDWNDESSLWY